MLDRPLFVWILAVYPVLFIAAANPGQASWKAVITACAVALLAATVILALARMVMPSWKRAALVTALFIVAFFAYGPVHGALEEGALREIEAAGMAEEMPTGRYHFLLSCSALLVVLIGIRVFQQLREQVVSRIGQGLNVAALVLIVLVGGQLAASAGTGATRDAPASAAESVSAGAVSPDIYYIILDGYARADVLGQYYGFDNSEFLDGLRQRGFEISENSFANYNWTFLSLGSSLNYQYIQDLLADRLDPGSKDRGAVYDLIRRNAAARFLRQRGYRFVHLQSTWGATRENPFADVQVRCHGGVFDDELYRVIAEASWLRILGSRATIDLAQCHLSNFESLGGMGRQPGPKFVFAHFILPHHPYLFDREGRILREAQLSNQFEFQKRLWERRDQYLDQLLYVNRRVMEAIDQILTDSARPPIIILQSDHGPNLRMGLSDQEYLHVRFANLAAYHLPGAPPGLIPAGSSPINQFRHVFNFYFDAGLEILPERHFASPYVLPFAFSEVDGLRSGQPRLLGTESLEEAPH